MSIPSFESGGSYETFSKIEKKEVNFDDFLKGLDKQREKIKEVRELEIKDRKKDEVELSIHEQFFDGKISLEEFQNSLKQQEITQTKEQTNQYEISGNISEISEKEKITTYGILSNLAYSEFKTVDQKEEQNKNLEIITVKLDPLSFPNIDKILDTPKPEILTAEEEVLYTYIQDNKDININNGVIHIASDIKDILRFSKFKNSEVKYAELDEKYRETLTDVIPNDYLDFDFKNIENTRLITRGLEHLRTQKIQENGKILEQLNGEFEVIDYFPKENDKTKSGFGAICLKGNDGNTYFAIRGTELTDWGDLKTDIGLIFNKVPQSQTKDMIDFVERNIKNLKPQEKFRVLGYSLGGALTQILTSMYSGRIDESYTFNSPGAKNLKVRDIEKTGDYLAKFKNFEYNKGRKDTGELLTNVSGKAGFSFISDLGEDIGEYKINLEGLSSHSIVELIKHVEKMDENEVVKIKVKQKSDLNRMENKD